MSSPKDEKHCEADDGADDDGNTNDNAGDGTALESTPAAALLSRTPQRRVARGPRNGSG